MLTVEGVLQNLDEIIKGGSIAWHVAGIQTGGNNLRLCPCIINMPQNSQGKYKK